MFVETEFGLLPIKKNFIIPTGFQTMNIFDLIEANRPFYGNKRFLEILESQPSLYEEHNFLYNETADALYKKFLEMLDDPESRFIETLYQEVEQLSNDCNETDDDYDRIYNLSDNPIPYTKNIESQFSSFIENLPIAISLYYDRRSVFGGSMELKKIQGKYLEKAMSRLKEDTLHIMRDTIDKKCNGKISKNPNTYDSFLKSAVEVACMLSKEFSFNILIKSSNKRMTCDLYKRYAKERRIEYIKTYSYQKFTDKNHILSVFFSPKLFKKIEPFAEELSEQFKSTLYTDYDEPKKYSNIFGEVNDVEINDFMTEGQKEMYRELNHIVRRFYINLRDHLSEEELKEFLTESKMFDEKNKSRARLIRNITRLSNVIIKEYEEKYKERDRLLILDVKDAFYKKRIKEGTLLYRGYKKIYGPINDKNSFSFFSLNPVNLLPYMQPDSSDDTDANTLEKYLSYMGGLAVFRLKKDIEVMDFSNLSSIYFMKKILKDENAPQDVIDAFEESWSITTEDEVELFKRQSIIETDLKFMSWLCSKGYGGYIGMDLEEFHDEIAICFSTKDKQNNRYVVEEDLDYIGTIEPGIYMNFCLTEEPYLSHPELNLKYIIPSSS
jgi:hypothetical protein